MKRWAAFAILLAVVTALVLRLPELERRPLHADESVNATKFSGLWEGRGYQYDPQEYHGPLLCYLTLPVAWLSVGAHGQFTEATLRLLPVLVGSGLILLLLLCRDAMGPAQCIWSAILLAVSPAMVFYSRYYIHEMLLVFCSFVFLGALWRYWRRPGVLWAAVAGLGLGGMHASKETFVFVLVAAFIAAVTCRALGYDKEPAARGEGERPTWLHLGVALLVALVVSVTLFSSFLSNPRGPLDSVRTYLPWFQRAGGASPHIHPWHFYFHRLLLFHASDGPYWSEALILLLGLVGIWAAMKGRCGQGSRVFYCFFAVYTVVLSLIYTLLPYKTPWCCLGFLHGYVVLAGLGAVTVIGLARRPAVRIGLIAMLALGVCHLAVQARQGALVYPADPRNPYVYAHTSLNTQSRLPNVLQLIERVKAITSVSVAKDETMLKVMIRSPYWPLPWYLRNYRQIGWWSELAQDPWAPIMIVEHRLNAEFDEASNKKWLMTGLYELRPGVFLELYVEFELWKKYIASRPPPREEDGE